MLQPSELKRNGQIAKTFYFAVTECNIAQIPGLVKEIIETQAWKERIQNGHYFVHAGLVDFIEAKPIAGCGWPKEKVEALIKDNPDILKMWRKAIAAKRAEEIDEKDRANLRPRGLHVDRDVDNERTDINNRPAGTSAAAALRRLRKDRPDIHARVLAGELSANAGMIEAGFRKKRPSKRITPLQQIQKFLPKLSEADREILLSELKSELSMADILNLDSMDIARAAKGIAKDMLAQVGIGSSKRTAGEILLQLCDALRKELETATQFGLTH